MREVSPARVGSKSCVKMVEASYTLNLERGTPMDNRQGSFAELFPLYRRLGGMVGTELFELLLN